MVSRVSVGSSFRDLTGYLTDRSERVEWVSAHGEVSAEPSIAAGQMEAVALMSRAEKPVLHVSVSFAEGDLDEGPGGSPWGSRERAERAVLAVLDKAGLSGHQALMVAHNDKDHPHVHVMLNRVSQHAPAAWDLDWHRLKVRLAVEEVEREQGFRLTGKNALDQGKELPVKMTRNEWDVENSGRRSFPRLVREEAGDALNGAGSWAELHRELARAGLRIERTQRGGLVTEDSGRTVSLSRVGRNVSFPKLERRLGPYVEARIEDRVAGLGSGTKGLGSRSGASADGRNNQPLTPTSPMAGSTTASLPPDKGQATPQPDGAARSAQMANDQAALQHAHAARAADRERRRPERSGGQPQRPEPTAARPDRRDPERAKAEAATATVAASALNKRAAEAPQKDAARTFQNVQPAQQSCRPADRLPGEIEGARKLPSEQRLAEGRAAVMAGKSEGEIAKAFNKYGVVYEKGQAGVKLTALKEPPRTEPPRGEPSRNQTTQPDRAQHGRGTASQPERSQAAPPVRPAEPSRQQAAPRREPAPNSGRAQDSSRALESPRANPTGKSEQRQPDPAPQQKPAAARGSQAGAPAQDRQAGADQPQKTQSTKAPSTAAPEKGSANSPSLVSNDEGGKKDNGKDGGVKKALEKGAKAGSTITRISEDDGSKLRAGAAATVMTYSAAETAFEVAKGAHRAGKAIKDRVSQEGPSAGASKVQDLAGAASPAAASPAASSKPRVADPVVSKLQLDAEKAGRGGMAQRMLPGAIREASGAKQEVENLKSQISKGAGYQTDLRAAMAKTYADPVKAEQALREVASKRGVEAVREVIQKNPASLGALKQDQLRPSNVFKDRTQQAMSARMGIARPAEVVLRHEKSLAGRDLPKAEAAAAAAMGKVRSFQAAGRESTPEVRAALATRFENLSSAQKGAFRGMASTDARAQIVTGAAEKAHSVGSPIKDAAEKAAQQLSGPGVRFPGIVKTAVAPSPTPGMGKQAAGLVAGTAMTEGATGAAKAGSSPINVLRAAMGQAKELSQIARGDNSNAKDIMLKTSQKGAMLIPGVGKAVAVAITAARKADDLGKKVVATGQER